MLKKLTCIMLCLLFVASAILFASCSGESEQGDESQVSVDGEATKGFLNEPKMWNQQVNILTYNNGNYAFNTCQIVPDEMTDEPVNDAFFERAAIIKEKYGIEIIAHYPDEGEDYVQLFRDDMISGLNEYDALAGQIVYITSLAIEGNLVDFNSVGNGYLHLDQPWWDSKLVNNISLNGKSYFITGDALVEDDESTWAMYFNKDLIKNRNLEDPYQLVRDDKWNLDKMYEMLQTVELTHGATKSYDPTVGDQWGMVAQSYDFYLFMQGCGQTLIDNTGDVPVIRIDQERNIQVYQKLANIIFDSVNVGVADHFGPWDSGVYTQETQIFANGNALFMPGSIARVSDTIMREAEIHYGILPMPKADELQDEYTTSINVYHYSVFCVPKTNVEKLDVTCYALEAMAYYGKELVTPEYYDRTLTYKRFNDDESGEMLDLIFRNRTYDMGSIFNFNGGIDYQGTLYFYTDLLGDKASKGQKIMSHFESRKALYQAGIDDLVDQCYSD